tara:strand:- start:8408 stop:8695 length:288 start_codon:yes stop_codon:yes gene_type:complete
MTKGLEEYMLPCLNKQLFGIECLGCGIQRAAALLFKGDFIAAFKMYPAIYPLLLFLLFILFNLFIKIKYAEKVKIILVTLSILLIVTNYVFKYII